MVPALFLAFTPIPPDRAALVDGVDSLIAPGALPGAVVAAKSAFVVMRTGDVPTVAAGPVAAGRAMVAGHGGFFSRDALKNPSNARLFANSLAWLGRRGETKGLRIGLFQTDDVASAAQALGAETINIRREDLKAGLAKVDVLMMGQNALDGDATAQADVVAWTKAGHGFYSAGPAWGWQQLNPNKNLRTDLSVNRMLLPFGLGLSGDFADGKPVAQGSDDPLLQTDQALAALRKGGLADAATVRAGGAVSRALALTPLNDPTLVAEIRRLAAKEGEKWPVTGTMPFTRMRAILDHRAWLEQGPETVRANPSAALFPGPVPKEAKRGTRSVEIDTKVPDWHGVGLYAAPGEVITVSLPAEAVGKGIGVRIGAHTDGLWDTKDWNRFPEISRRWPLDTAKTKVASPFGGTIFLDVPQGATLGKVSVTIEGAVPAVRYVRGKTTKAEWDRMRREPGGPWVEMEAKEIILSLPRSAILNLEDPETAMAYWDEMAELCYELYAAPRRPRAERFCVDRQISVGYMHAGYPIMTHEDVSNTFVDVPKMRSKDFPWGFYHELGHNFQEPAWTFEGTGEVTNNLFSLYACEKINGIAHPGAMSLEEKKPRMEKYFAKGAKYEDWQSDPFLALTMYDQIREEFGWEPFKKAFANYHRLKLNPKDEGARRDTWMVQISEATGRNLGPFFTMWGVPTSESARASVANLPKWMPAEGPSL